MTSWFRAVDVHPELTQMIGANLGYRLLSPGRSLLLVLQGSNLANEEARRSTSYVNNYAPPPGASLVAGSQIEF